MVHLTQPTRTKSTLERALLHRVDGEIRFDDQARSAWSTDASNYRQIPLGVVLPRTVEAAAEAVALCRDHGAPIVSRGGGTSLGGQCTNAAVVLDFSRHCNRLLSVDTGARRCVVEPGIVLDELNRQLAPTGLRFGPEPATHMNCTIGGMLGNNSCGTTAQRTGKTVDNTASLDVLLYDGTRFTCGPTPDEDYRTIETRGDRRAAIYRSLRRLRDAHADLIRDRYPQIPRRVSGYNLDELLPENGFDVARLLVGSESTLATVLHAELRLVPVVPATALVVLGFEDVAGAGDAVPHVLEHGPVALEGIDDLLIRSQQVKGWHREALDLLPKGRGFLMVKLGGEDDAEATDRANAVVRAFEGTAEAVLAKDPDEARELWLVRESALGATARVTGHPDAFDGWEDSAVAPEQLGDYLRDLHALLEEFDYTSDVAPSLYGHFGQGCVHTRIPFDLYTTEGVRTFRSFVERAADLVVAYGGSLSGEHGDGQARGELLTRMFGSEVVGLFEEVKALFDPDDRMNPGKVVRPAPLDSHLRLGGSWKPHDPATYFRFPHDDSSFARAANRCVGVGKCRVPRPEGSVMCPSYQVTGAEEHSTRGRSRLLFEMLDGHGDGLIHDGWQSTEVRDALDLCLACKGCKTDCPAGVDMATYKAEFLSHHYRHRLRPRADYATGWLPAVAIAVARLRLAGPVNALAGSRIGHRLAVAAGGLEDRPLPRFADQTLQQWWRQRPPSRRGTRDVVLWPDTFTNVFAPEIGQAAVEVVEAAGWNVSIPTRPVCCGLTWISTGQLGVARRVLRHTARLLAPQLRAGALVVGLEPSCTAVFRADAEELFPDDDDVGRLRKQIVTLAELLTAHTPDWAPPRVAAPARGVAQVHCHQHAVMRWDADRQLLESMGIEVERLDSGCCGLAGNFGMTAGHGSVSEAIAEQALLPRLRSAAPETLVLADGFSCRKQIHDLDSGGREGVHLAEVLAAALHRADPVRSALDRPRRE